MTWWRTIWQCITALFRTRKEKPMQPAIPTKHRPWTFMVYMAGDNGKVFYTAAGPKKLMAEMTTAGYTDIWKMAQVGTTDACAVVCLFDTQEEAYFVEVRPGQGMADSRVEVLGEVNTGAPNTLRDFIVRGIRQYPADRYALVIWNHGTGWLDVDHYAVVRDIGDSTHQTHNAIFRSTVRQMAEARAADGTATTRPIAFDDSSKDFLDTKDLHKAFSEAEALTGRRLDLIGMDACLMAMVEGARELAAHADYFVGSQEVEPMNGWPYALILQGLNVTPGMAPADLADRVVRDYAKAYNAATRPDETVTQSAIRLAATSETESLTRVLVDAVLARGQEAVLRSKANEARTATVKFQDRNYRDLGDFARILADKASWEGYSEVATAAQALYAHLYARAAQAPVLQVAFRPAYAGATGMSVYLPPAEKPLSQRQKELATYRQLAFPQATGWDRLVEWLNGDF